MPLYTLTLALVFFAGFATVLILPHLKNGDLALLTVVGISLLTDGPTCNKLFTRIHWS